MHITRLPKLQALKPIVAFFALFWLVCLPALLRRGPRAHQEVFSSDPVKHRIALYSIGLPLVLGAIGFLRGVLLERRTKRAIAQERGGWRRFLQDLSQKPVREGLREMQHEYHRHRPAPTAAQARFWATADRVGASGALLVVLANVALWCVPPPPEPWWILLLEWLCLGVCLIPYAFDASRPTRGWLGWGVTWLVLRTWRHGVGLALTPRLVVLALSLMLLWAARSSATVGLEKSQ